MNILHTADWHLGKIVNEYSMIDLQKEALDQIIYILEQENIDVIVVSGDIYDRSIPSIEAINLLDYFLSVVIKKLNKKVILISGNHDSKGRLGFASSLMESNNLFIVTKVEPTKICIDDTIFYAIPYANLSELKLEYKKDFKSSEEAYKYIISEINLDHNYKNILIMHDYVTSGILETSDSERPLTLGALEFIDASIFEEFDYVALGHIHKPQKVKNENIRYSGSLLKYSFSEKFHQKSVVVINDNIKLIPLKQSKDLIEITDQLDNILKEEIYTKYNLNDYFKINLTDTRQVIDASIKLKQIFPNLMEIHYNKIDSNYKAINKEYKNKSFKDLYLDFFNHVGHDVNDDDLVLIDKVVRLVGEDNENN